MSLATKGRLPSGIQNSRPVSTFFVHPDLSVEFEAELLLNCCEDNGRRVGIGRSVSLYLSAGWAKTTGEAHAIREDVDVDLLVLDMYQGSCNVVHLTLPFAVGQINCTAIEWDAAIKGEVIGIATCFQAELQAHAKLGSPFECLLVLASGKVPIDYACYHCSPDFGYERVAIERPFTECSGLGITELVDLQKKPPTIAKEFSDAQDAIDSTLDALLPRLIESNDSLIAALTRLRDFYLTGTPMPGAEAVLAEVETGLERAARAWRGS